MKFFRLKSALCLLLIPPIWCMASKVDEHHTCCFKFLFFFFLSTKSLYCCWISYEGIFNTNFGRYPTFISPESIIVPQRKTINQIKYRDFYDFKQIKFELFVVFSLNLAPIMLLISGEHNLIYFISYIFHLLGGLYLESHFEYKEYSQGLIYLFFLVKILFQVPIFNNPKTSTFLKWVSQLSPMWVSHFSIGKICAPDFFPFVMYALYTIYHDNKRESRIELKKALSFERTYDSTESI